MLRLPIVFVLWVLVGCGGSQGSAKQSALFATDLVVTNNSEEKLLLYESFWGDRHVTSLFVGAGFSKTEMGNMVALSGAVFVAYKSGDFDGAMQYATFGEVEAASFRKVIFLYDGVDWELEIVSDDGVVSRYPSEVVSSLSAGIIVRE